MCAELCCEKPSHSRRWRLPEAFPGAPVLCKDRRVQPGRTELAAELLNRSCPKHLFSLWHHHSTGSAGLLCRKLHPWDSPTKAAWPETSTPDQVAAGQAVPSWWELCSAEQSVPVQHSWTSITTLIKPAGESTSYFCHTEERGGFLLLDYAPVAAESNEPQSKQNDTM